MGAPADPRQSLRSLASPAPKFDSKSISASLLLCASRVKGWCSQEKSALAAELRAPTQALTRWLGLKKPWPAFYTLFTASKERQEPRVWEEPPPSTSQLWDSELLRGGGASSPSRRCRIRRQTKLCGWGAQAELWLKMKDAQRSCFRNLLDLWERWRSWSWSSRAWKPRQPRWKLKVAQLLPDCFFFWAFLSVWRWRSGPRPRWLRRSRRPSTRSTLAKTSKIPGTRRQISPWHANAKAAHGCAHNKSSFGISAFLSSQGPPATTGPTLACCGITWCSPRTRRSGAEPSERTTKEQRTQLKKKGRTTQRLKKSRLSRCGEASSFWLRTHFDRRAGCTGPLPFASQCFCAFEVAEDFCSYSQDLVQMDSRSLAPETLQESIRALCGASIGILIGVGAKNAGWVLEKCFIQLLISEARGEAPGRRAGRAEKCRGAYPAHQHLYTGKYGRYIHIQIWARYLLG